MIGAHITKWGNLYIVAGFSILGCTLYYLDISYPYYKLVVQRKLDEIKLKEEEEELKFRLLAFPLPNKTKHIKNFVIREIEKAEEYMVNGDQNKAVEHFANGLSLIDNNSKLCSLLRKKVPIKMYRKIREQVQDIQNMLPQIKT